MEQYIFDLAKSMLAAGGGTLGGWLLSRKTAKKVNKLEAENAQQKLNVDGMQSTLIAQQSQLIRYQDELIKTKDEVEKLKAQVHSFELKSTQDEITKQSLRGRIAELEEVCDRQEQEIEKLKAELAATSTRLNILEN